MIFENRYGRLDRLLHRLAFRAGMAQHAMADVEDMLYRDALRSIDPGVPVFISALPRSGTTTLLNLLVGTGRFATHTYQDMPFILCPMLWSQFSRRFARDDTPRERAHGDGIMLSSRSPEAFEEMIWKHFWPRHYERTRILPWTAADSDPEFNEFLDRHMRKVVAVRRRTAPTADRYLSKNNLNIARLGALPPPLQGGVILVPFREPLQHAASMLRQHTRFLKIHAEDPFVRRYMEAIGHHEFGMGLRPVDFGGWVARAPQPTELAFWLEYWIAAYGFVHGHLGSKTMLVSYEHLTREPDGALGRLAEETGTPAMLLTSQAGDVHPPRLHPIDASSVSASSLDQASELYQRLEAAAFA